jgi:hypothetical protein
MRFYHILLGGMHMLSLKKVLLCAILLALLVPVGCAMYEQQSGTVKGGAVGAGVGGLAGAMLDSHNPWRGGVIGAALGAVLGGTLGDISDKGSREAVRHNRPVEYRTEDGRGYYRAEPEGVDPITKCHKVHEKVFEDGKLVKDHVKEVCEAQKSERRY